MSELVKHNKYGIMKLGTCQDLYYITYDQLEKELPNMTQRPGNLAPKDYLNPRYGFRYRFPFPDEAGLTETHEDFERGFQISIPRNLFPQGAIEIAHKTFYHRIEHKSGYRFTLNTPCPADENGKLEFNDYSNIRGNLILEIVQQKIVETRLTTLVRCPFCGAVCRLSEDEITTLYNIVHDENLHYDDMTKQVVSIAKAGYTRFTTTEKLIA